MVLAFDNNVRRDCPALGIDALDHRSPFPIARLGQLRLASPVRAYNNYRCGDLTYYKAGLVEVIDILVLDTVFSFQVREKRELARDFFNIFVEGPLIVVYTRKTCPEVSLSFNEVRSLTCPDI